MLLQPGAVYSSRSKRLHGLCMSANGDHVRLHGVLFVVPDGPTPDRSCEGGRLERRLGTDV
jgi:hypothetical protein